MFSTMHTAAFVLVCLPYGGFGRRAQLPIERLQSSFPFFFSVAELEHNTNALEAFAMLMAAFNHAAAGTYRTALLAKRSSDRDADPLPMLRNGDRYAVLLSDAAESPEVDGIISRIKQAEERIETMKEWGVPPSKELEEEVKQLTKQLDDLRTRPKPTVGEIEKPMTVSQARSVFYATYRGSFDQMMKTFVEEMLESVIIAMQSPAFLYTRVFALGFESLCKIVLRQSSKTDEDGERVRRALLIALGMDPDITKRDAEALRSFAKESTEEQLFASEDFTKIAGIRNFRYIYPFGAGLLATMQTMGQEMSDETIQRWCEKLNFPSRNVKKLQKDRDIYKVGRFPSMINLYGWGNSGLFEDAFPE